MLQGTERGHNDRKSRTSTLSGTGHSHRSIQMTIEGFELGRMYNRRRDIHATFGGQQQGGIITPSKYPLIFAITGASGRQHGYEDRWVDDGSFRYFGEGQVGDRNGSEATQLFASTRQTERSCCCLRWTRPVGCNSAALSTAPDTPTK